MVDDSATAATQATAVIGQGDLPDHDLVGRLELIADEINLKDSVYAVMESIVAAVVKHTPWTQCWVAMVDIEERRVLHDYHAGDFDPAYRFELRDWDMTDTVTLDAARTGSVIAIGDVEHSAYPYLHEASASAGVRATLYAAVPFDHDSHSVVINVSLPRAHEFSAAEISLARGITTFAAIAFRNILATDRAIEHEAQEKVKLAELNTTILEKNAALEQVSHAQARLLRLQTVGADVSALCAEISGLLEMPVLLLDPFYQQLGLTGMAVPDADAITAHLAGRGRVSGERLESRPAILTLDGTRYVVTNVVEDHALVAMVVLQVEGDAPSSLAMRILELARVHVSLMVMRFRSSFETEARFAREFVDALAGDSSNLTITQHAGLLGLPLQSTSQIMLARVSGLTETLPRRDFDELVQFVASRLRQTGFSMIAAPAGDCELMIVLTSVNTWGSERVTLALRRAIADGARLIDASADRVSVAVGIGGGFSGIDGLRRSHREATRALQITLSSGHVDGDLSFDEAGTYAVLAATPAEDRRHFVQRYMKPLLDYDRMHGGAFFETLRTYFESIGNIPRTAERLFLHVSTVRYRLRRIEELTGMSLEDEEDRLRLQLCLRFSRLSDLADA
ncbi:helix-turn-helix domain-containing protein [Microbacter sp. GSS18]|nr:helix-turn-helix domain-containing protein [Microbacter sp. GSS18]